MSKQPEQTNKNILNIYQLPINEKDNILEYESEPSFSIYPNMPLFKYGFYHYIHQTKDKMELFEKSSIKDVHKIINAFEDTVPQEEAIKQYKNDNLKASDDINTFSIKYFNSDKIISRAFYKLWELIIMFPLIKDQTKNITTIHIAEAPGSFVQSVIYYRKKFFNSDQISGDKYIGTSIDPPQRKSSDYVPAFNNDLLNNKLFQKWSYKDSDLTKVDIINKFVLDNSKNKADLITADGGFNWKNENYQEQEAYILLLSEIYCALQTQKTGGSFVIKFFETFTELTVKMIEILKRFYETIIITKPLLSRPSNSERYIVCHNFLNKQNDSNLKYIDKIYEIIKVANSNTDKYLVDIFPDYQINPALDIVIKLSSTQLSNEQHKQINNMITYYNNGNYYGDEYRQYLTNRREANDYWISLFYPITTKDLNNTRKVINELIKDKIKIITKTVDDLKSKLEITYFDLDNSKKLYKSDTETDKSESIKPKTKKNSK